MPKLGLPVRRRCVLVLAPAPCWHPPPNVSRLPTQPIAWPHGGQQGRLHTELADILTLHKTAINQSFPLSLAVCLSIYLCHLQSLVGPSQCLGACISSVSQSTWGLFPAFTSRFWPSSQPRSSEFEETIMCTIPIPKQHKVCGWVLFGYFPLNSTGVWLCEVQRTTIIKAHV